VDSPSLSSIIYFVNFGPFEGTCAPAIDPPILMKSKVKPSGLHLTFSPRISTERIMLKNMVILEVHAMRMTPAKFKAIPLPAI